MPDFTQRLESRLQFVIPREDLLLEVAEIDHNSRQTAKNDVRQRGAIHWRHAARDSFVGAWPTWNDPNFIKHLRQTRGNGRMMISRRIETASKNGDAFRHSAPWQLSKRVQAVRQVKRSIFRAKTGCQCVAPRYAFMT